MSLKDFNRSRLFFQLSRKEVLFSWAVVVLVFTLLILYAFEISKFENTIDASGLIGWSLTYGAVLGAMIATYYIQKLDDLTDRFKAFTFIFISVLFFAPLIGSLLNRLGSFRHIEKKEYEIFEAEKIASEEQNQRLKIVESDYFIFVFENNELEKIRLRDQTEEPKKGNKITLEIHRGLFGWNRLEGHEYKNDKN